MSESPTPSTTEVVDPRFKYQDIAPPQLPVPIFDAMMFAVLDPEPVKKMGVWGLIVTGIRGLVVIIWLTGREKLIKMNQELTKQQYERDQAGRNQKDIDRDDLASQKRNP